MFEIKNNVAAKARFNALFDKSGKKTGSEVTVVTEYGDFRLPKNHAISRSVAFPGSPITEQHVTDMVNGGSYFVERKEDKVLDFRPNNYNGYVMDQPQLDSMVEHIGSNIIQTGARAGFLQGEREPQDLIIQINGHDNPENIRTKGLVSFNPFESAVQINHSIERMWCANGQVSDNPFLDRKVPIMNLPLSNMNIAFDSLKVIMDNLMTKRLNEMKFRPVSVADMSQLYTIFRKRLNETKKIDTRLLQSLDVVDVSQKEVLKNAYKTMVFDDVSLMSQLQGDISEYEYWNLITQVMTHTEGSIDANNVLNKMASDILFDGSEFHKIQQMRNSPKVRMATDTEHMFMGVVGKM